MISNAVNQVFTIGNKNKNVASNPNANQIHMGSFTSSTSMTLSNNNYNAELSSNSLELRSESTFNRTYLRNYTLDGTYNANEFMMECSSTDGNSISLVNKNNANNTNSLVMSSDKITTLWSSNDLRLYSSGAVRINANTNASGGNTGSSQDIHLTCQTLHVYYYGKISFHDGGVSGTRRNLSFGSDGIVRWTS